MHLQIEIIGWVCVANFASLPHWISFLQTGIAFATESIGFASLPHWILRLHTRIAFANHNRIGFQICRAIVVPNLEGATKFPILVMQYMKVFANLWRLHCLQWHLVDLARTHASMPRCSVKSRLTNSSPLWLLLGLHKSGWGQALAGFSQRSFRSRMGVKGSRFEIWILAPQATSRGRYTLRCSAWLCPGRVATDFRLFNHSKYVTIDWIPICSQNRVSQRLLRVVKGC